MDKILETGDSRSVHFLLLLKNVEISEGMEVVSLGLRVRGSSSPAPQLLAYSKSEQPHNSGGEPLTFRQPGSREREQRGQRQDIPFKGMSL